MEVLFGPWSRFERLTGNNILIEPLVDAMKVIDALKSHERYSAGWFYPPLGKVPGDFSQNPPLVPAPSYTLPVTHRLTVTGDLSSPEAADFIIALIGLLDGIRITREHWSHFFKTPIELRRLGDLLCDASEISAVLDIASATWFISPSEVRERLFGAIHWLTLSELFEHDFGRFFGYYTALDTLHWICENTRGHRAPTHAKRPSFLADQYGVPSPSWAKVEGKDCPLSALRNEFFHEARFAGYPIGFAYPKGNIILELSGFVRRLVLATLSVECGYVRSEVTTMQFHGLDLRPHGQGTAP